MTQTSTGAADANPPALRLLNAGWPLVIGHRGYNALAPENTLPSFILAMAAGADLVELDYRHSQDGVPVVIHDVELDRTTDARKRWGGRHINVDSKTAAEIRSLDAGGWYDPKFAGTKVPLLSEALDTIRDRSVPLIERKAGDAATCVKLLRDKELINHVVVVSFDWDYLRVFHELEPTQVLGALGPPGLLPDGRKPLGLVKRFRPSLLDKLPKTGAKVLVWNQHVSKGAVQLAHQRGLRVWIYTVGSPELANRLLDMGVNGIITNDPSPIRKTVSLRRRAPG